ncbi:MAG: hypothetical protein HYX27_03550 [Acidobacteria bacterium]|nr:hypothetical protein [Acidobacteriota bacterium]
MWFQRLAAVLLLTGCAAPLPAVDFSGSWTLAVAKSDFGRANPPQSLAMRVKQSNSQLAVESTLVDGRGATTSAYTLDLTGKETENQMRGNKVVSVSTWRGSMLQVKAKTSVQGTDVKTVDQWQLDESGSTLTVYRTATTPNGEFEQRFVYEKSPVRH